MYACVCTDWKPVSVPGLKCKLCQRLRHGEVTREAGTRGQQTLVVATRTHNGKAQPLTALRQTTYCTLRQAYPPRCRPTADYSSLHRPSFTGPQPITVPSTDGRLPAPACKNERGCSTRPCRRPLIPLFGSGIPDQQTASPPSSLTLTSRRAWRQGLNASMDHSSPTTPLLLLVVVVVVVVPPCGKLCSIINSTAIDFRGHLYTRGAVVCAIRRETIDHVSRPPSPRGAVVG